MAQDSTQYPFIGSNGSERGGLMNNPSVNSAFFTTPTANFTAAMLAGSIGIGFAPGGKIVNKFNGTQYAIPVYKNQ